MMFKVFLIDKPQFNKSRMLPKVIIKLNNNPNKTLIVNPHNKLKLIQTKVNNKFNNF